MGHGQFKGTYSIQTHQRKVTGAPLVWDQDKLFLLTGYGAFDEVEFDDVKSYKKKSDARIVYSRNSFQKKLKIEFGSAYQISQTQDYLVVHAHGQSGFWPQRIQSVYTSFQNYFQGRRINLAKRQYPLVAIIFKTRKEFDDYAKKNQNKIDPNVVGYYSPNSNRVLMYDQSKTGKLWQSNFDTIVHEIAHQAAFNCGIHGRFADTPRWAVEGLGTMFEAKGVYHSLKHKRQTDRLNPGLLHLFNNKVLQANRTGWIGPILVGNRLFNKDPELAYSCSWALTFYLMETQPYEYMNYMRKLNRLPAFQSYSQQDRLSHFVTHFGDIARLEGAAKNFFAKFGLE